MAQIRRVLHCISISRLVLTFGKLLGTLGIASLGLPAGALGPILPGPFSGSTPPPMEVWDTRFFHPGAGPVTAFAQDQQGRLYAAGGFTIIGNTAANGIAVYDGAMWKPLGTGIIQGARAMVTDGRNIYVAGNIFLAGELAVRNVAKWDGNSWSALGNGLDSPVDSLTVHQGTLYAGGVLSTSGNTESTPRIARWNGTSWESAGFPFTGSIPLQFLSTESTLFVGAVQLANGQTFAPLSKYQDGEWSTINQTNVKLAGIHQGRAYAVQGQFLMVWDGTAFTQFAPLPAAVTDVTVSSRGNDLIIGGLALGENLNRIWAYDGGSWTLLGTDLGTGRSGDPSIRALTFFRDRLWVGGTFGRDRGDEVLSNIAVLDGNDFRPLASNFARRIDQIALHQNQVIIAGSLVETPDGTANRIARWDTSQWVPLGTGGANDRVLCLLSAGDQLYAGGSFTEIGGVSANRIARWDGQAWHALGAGVDSTVFDLVISEGQLIAAGEFKNAGGSPALNIARWDGAAWNPIGAGLGRIPDPSPLVFPSDVRALAVHNGALHAGGTFNNSGAASVQYIARWTGTEWVQVGQYPSNIVSRLISHNGRLYVMGGAGTQYFDGTNFVAELNVQVIVRQGQQVYAYSIPEIKRWTNGAWEPMGIRIDGAVGNVAELGGNLWLHGSFLRRDGQPAYGFARRSVVMATETEIVPLNEPLAESVILGDGPDRGLYQPRLTVEPGSSLIIKGEESTPNATGRLTRARVIQARGKVIRNAFEIFPNDLEVSGTARLRIEFTDDDTQIFGARPNEFRPLRLTYPGPGQPAREPGSKEILTGKAVPIRMFQGQNVYAIDVPLTGKIGGVYGALPESAMPVSLSEFTVD